MGRTMSDGERNRYLEVVLNEYFGDRGKARVLQIEDVIYIEIHAPFSKEAEAWVRQLCSQPKWEMEDSDVRLKWEPAHPIRQMLYRLWDSLGK